MTSAIEQPATAEQLARLKELAGKPGGAGLAAAGSVELVAVKLSATTGELLRTIPLFHVDDPEPIHGLNSYASPTSVLHEGRCYCHFGTWGTACLDASSGEILWQRTLKLDHMVGPGSSPVLHEGLLILTCDGGDRQFIAALDAATGESRWETSRPPLRTAEGDMRKAFSTPLAIEVAGRTQLVIPGAQWFAAYDPATGKELWRVDHGSGFSNVPRPVYDGRRAYLTTGFVRPELLAVRPDGSGDVTCTHVEWRFAGQVPTQPSPVLIDGRLLMVSDNGVATCIDAATGEQIWRKRIAGNYSASPLVAAGRVYFCNREGTTTVLDGGPEFRVLAKNELDGAIMASPAVVHEDLLLRTETHLYRIGDDQARNEVGDEGLEPPTSAL
ncbi:MAG: PQQ-like beta-propeller repeat protein [Pirellulales bacterium]|nr:PQQ-like beta-propeller repeat protein [Pirellulales bacterium]